MYFHSHFLPDLQYYHAIEGGRRGELYHQYRILPKDDPRGDEIAREGHAYHDHIPKPGGL
jgi:hypothetical protein